MRALNHRRKISANGAVNAKSVHKGQQVLGAVLRGKKITDCPDVHMRVNDKIRPQRGGNKTNTGFPIRSGMTILHIHSVIPAKAGIQINVRTAKARRDKAVPPYHRRKAPALRIVLFFHRLTPSIMRRRFLPAINSLSDSEISASRIIPTGTKGSFIGKNEP